MSAIPPTPFLPTARFDDESLLLATEPIFNVSLGDDGDESWLIPSTPGPSKYRSIRRVLRTVGRNKTLDLDAYLPEEEEEPEEEEGGQETRIAIVEERDSGVRPRNTTPEVVAAGSSKVQRRLSTSSSLSGSARHPRALGPHRDDLFARRLSDTRRSSFSPIPPPSSVMSTPFVPKRNVSPATSFGPSSITTSEGLPSEVRMAWKESLSAPRPTTPAQISCSLRRSVSEYAPSSHPQDTESSQSSKTDNAGPSVSAVITPTQSLEIPLPTLTELSDTDSSLTSKTPKEDKRSSRSERLVEFFTGFLSSSQSGASAISSQTDTTKLESDTLTEAVDDLSAEMPGGYANKIEGAPSRRVFRSANGLGNFADWNSGPPKATHDKSIPGYIPLTRPLAPRPFQNSRNIVPQRGPSQDSAEKGKPRPATSSAFASAALAKLPPPGKGSTSSNKPIKVRTPERASDLAIRRNVFERKSNASSPKRSTATLTRTIPLTGRTPGKASRARAAQREAYDAALRERLAEKEREKRALARLKEEEAEEAYSRKRKETVIWARPVPDIYKKAH